MKKKLKRKIIWLDEWKIREQEAWFSDMSSQGWELIKLGSVFATFEEADPQEVFYRCDVFNVEDGYDRHRSKLYRQSGWEFVDSRRHIQIFKEIEPGQASEVYATPVERAETLVLLQKKIKNKGLLALLSTVLIVILNIYLLQMNPVENYLNDGFIVPIYTIIISIFFVLHMITGIVHMAKLIKRLKLEEVSENYINYHGIVNRKKAFSMCGVILLGSLLTYLAIDIGKLNDDDWYLDIPQGDLPVVQMSDIMNKTEYEQVIIPAYYEPYDNFYSVDSSILVPRQYELYQSVLVDGSGSDRLSIRSYGYEVRNEQLAQKVTQALKEQYSEYEPVYEAVSNGKFDELWVNKYHSTIKILARNGHKVYHFIYNGTDINDEKMEKILSKIEENL